MTEITGNNGLINRPWFSMKPSRETRLIDPLAFVGALIGAPILIAVVFCFVFLIPVFAVGFGAVPYLILGTPTYLWLLSRGEERKTRFALAGLILNLIGSLLIAASSSVGFYDSSETFQLYITLGSIFAPLWSAAFVWLYSKYRRDRFLPNHN